MLQFFTNQVAYKTKEVPIYKQDFRYKSGQRHVGNKVVNDIESAIPMPKKGLIIGYITNLIFLSYFLCLGLPAAHGIYSFYNKDRDKRIEKMNDATIQSRDSIVQKTKN